MTTQLFRRNGKGETMPVFDRKHDRTTDEAKTGLTPRSVVRADFSRTDRDRRPGTPVTAQLLGDPPPDRLERAEALRQALVARTNRFKIEGSEDQVKVRGAYDGRAGRSKTPDIPKPLGYYVDITVEDAALEARRGDEVLYFYTYTDAARCMIGKRASSKDTKTIQNAASGIVKSAFGWTWTRLKLQRKRRS